MIWKWNWHRKAGTRAAGSAWQCSLRPARCRFFLISMIAAKEKLCARCRLLPPANDIQGERFRFCRAPGSIRSFCRHFIQEVFIMKSLYKLAFSSGLAAMGLFGLQGSAMALTTINGNICQIANAFPNGQVFRQANAISVLPGVGAQLVFCPVVRIAAAPASGYSVLFDGSKAAGGSQVTCSLESYNFNNQFMGRASASVFNAGNFSGRLTLPAAQVPAFSHQVVVCLLPAESSLFEIEPASP
jgi:hypothetical protein